MSILENKEKIKNLQKTVNHELMLSYQLFYETFQDTEMIEKESVKDYEKRVIENTNFFKLEEVQNNKEILKMFKIAESVYLNN